MVRRTHCCYINENVLKVYETEHTIDLKIVILVHLHQRQMYVTLCQQWQWINGISVLKYCSDQCTEKELSGTITFEMNT